MFDASLEGSDVVMTMKDFNKLTANSSLAGFLEHNYANGKGEDLFRDLKSLSNMNAFTNGLNAFTGKEMLSRFAFEDMTMMRELNFDMNNHLFHNKAQHFEVAGSVRPMAFRGDTGSNARYSLFNKRDGATSIGLGVAFTDTRSDDTHNANSRKETMFQMVVPMGYRTHGIEMVTSPRLGYARGDYDRTGYKGRSYDGTIEKRVYGLMNEARYPIEIGDWKLEPAAEFNVLGYTQKGKEEAKEYALNIRSQNTYSVEGGIGLYLSQTKELGKDEELKILAGVAAYHEFADPYRLDVGMQGMDGTFRLRDDKRSDNRAVVRAGFDYTKGDVNLYTTFMSFIDNEIRTSVKSGFKLKF